MDRRDEGRLRRQEAKGLSRVSYIAWSGLGSGLTDQSQKMTVAARAMAEKKAIGQRRSEEHTSELQSLMRISYAVFCLKKKKIIHYKRLTAPKTYQSNHTKK